MAPSPTLAHLSTKGPDHVLVVLQSAVTLARSYQIRTVAALRRSLSEHHPNQEALIDQALTLWAEYERQKPGSD